MLILNNLITVCLAREEINNKADFDFDIGDITVYYFHSFHLYVVESLAFLKGHYKYIDLQIILSSYTSVKQMLVKKKI